MKLRTELPHVRVELKQGAGWYGLPVSQRDDVKAAWMRGQAFYDGVDLWGDEVTIKLGDVSGVTLRTQAGCDAIDEEDEERKRRKLTESD